MKKNKKGWWVLLATLAVTIILFLLTTKTVANVETDTIISPDITASIAEKPILVSKIDEMPQVLLDIAYAESHNDPKDIGYNYRYKIIKNNDGSVTKIKYLWSKDIGRFQLNDFYNQKYCRDAGFDIYDDLGNANCALKMYNEQGTEPWNASKYCWSNIDACKAKRGGAYYKK